MKAREYRMSARAESAQHTGDAIVDAMLNRFRDQPFDRIRLEDVAVDAGVTVQTVIRRFGSKAALMVATVTRELDRIAAAREAADGQSPQRTLEALAEHYERYGALILKTYSEAPLIEGMPEIAEAGRVFHVDWCRRTFAPHLGADLDEPARRRRLAQIVAICDATTWRILRFYGALDPDETGRALMELITPLLGAGAISAR